MAPAGIEPRSHWWKASALAAVPSLLPLYICVWQNTTCYSKNWRICIQSQTFSNHVISQASCKQCNWKVQQPGENIKYPFLKVNKSQYHNQTLHMAKHNPIYCDRDHLSGLANAQFIFKSIGKI